MKRNVGLVILIATVCSTFLKAQDNSGTDKVIYSNGSEEYGIIDLTDLNEKGIIYFSTDTEKKEIVYPSQIKEIAIKTNRVIIGKRVKYLNKDNEYRVDDYFAESVIQGSASLYRVFGTSYQYALESQNGVEALQVTKNGDVINETYKGIFYLAFEGCRGGIKTLEIRYTLTDFIKALNKYNSCMDPSYKSSIEVKVKETLLEIEPRLGVNISSLKVIVDDNSNYEPEELDMNNSISVGIGLVLRYGIIKDRILLISDIGYTKYQWDVSSGSKKTFSTPLEHREAYFSLGMEGRYTVNDFDIHATGGVRMNVTLFDQSQDPTVSLNYNDPNFPLRSTHLYSPSARKSEYYTYFIELGLAKEIKENIAVGFSAKANFGAEEVFTQKEDRHYDEFNYNIALSFFARYKLKFVK
jgi:hypothetical protein